MSPVNPFLTTPAAPRQPALNTYSNAEWAIDLPASWRVIPTDTGNSVTFQSDAERAGLFISVDFYEIPADKAQATADRLVNDRLSQHAADAPGRVDMFDSASEKHWQGTGHEARYAVQVGGRDIVQYAVQVMSRRVLNLTLACSRRDRESAAALFAAIRAHFRPALA